MRCGSTLGARASPHAVVHSCELAFNLVFKLALDWLRVSLGFVIEPALVPALALNGLLEFTAPCPRLQRC
jgi:hypothetical protein